jgi:hypothetical protein
MTATVMLVMLMVLVRVVRAMMTVMIWADDPNRLSSLCDARNCTIRILSLDFDKGGRSANEGKDMEEIVMVPDDILGRL